MIEINQTTFRRAIRKAAAVKPAVTHTGIRYLVSRPDGNLATVKFTARNGNLWASCDCPAGAPAGRYNPLPCYHVGAILILSAQAQALRANHKHHCPYCDQASIFTCNCSDPDQSNYDCDCLDELAGTHRDSDYWQ